MNIELFWALNSSKNQKVGSSNLPPATKTLWKDRENQGIAEAGLALRLGRSDVSSNPTTLTKFIMDLQLEW